MPWLGVRGQTLPPFLAPPAAPLRALPLSEVNDDIMSHRKHIAFASASKLSSWSILHTKSRSSLHIAAGIAALVAVFQAKLLAVLSWKAMTEPFTCCKLIECHALQCCEAYASDVWLQFIFMLL